MSDRNKFDPGTQSSSLRDVVGKAKERRKKDKRNPFKWLGNKTKNLEEMVGGLKGKAVGLGAHAGTGAGIGATIAMFVPFIGPALAIPAAGIGAVGGSIVYGIGKYTQPKDEDEGSSYYI